MSSAAESGREDLLALIEDLRKRLDTMEEHVRALPPGDVDLAVMRTIWEPNISWHWNGEEEGTLEKFVEVLVRGATVNPERVIDEYLAAWHQSTRYDSDEILDL
jgi:hypothetical protein